MEKKLKIGFDAKRLFLNNTGLGNYSRNLVKNLKQLYPEHEYHLFTPKVVEHKVTNFFLDNDFIIHTNKTWHPDWYWRSYGVSSIINNLELDVFHGLSHEIPYGIHKRTKTIVTIHDLIYEKYPELFGWWNSKIYQQKYRSSCNRADVVLSISNATAKDVANLYALDANKIKTIYQTCDEKFQSQPITTKNKTYFLYVGTINERKSLKDIVVALNQLPEAQKLNLVIVGEGGIYKKEVFLEITKLNLGNYIEFKGNLNNDDLIWLYDNAICLILPSQYEGFGIPIIESLFRKTPVITCENSALPEAGGKGALYIEHGNINQLTRAMVEIQKDDVWKKLSNEGYQHVIQKFGLNKVTVEVMHLYERTSAK